MTSDTSTPTTDTLETEPKRKPPVWALPVGALVIGLAIGGTVGAVAATSDPTQSEEYGALEQDLEAAQDRVQSLSDRAREVQSSAQRAQDEAAQRQAELDSRAAELAEREAAVTAVEAQVAANSITNGIWTVGVDVEPGTYRVSEALTGYCYWAIYRTGSNGRDIIENDGPTGGFPTVTLSVGQDFENSRCGTFVKQ